MSVYSERGDKLKKENKAAVDKQTAAKKDELDQQIDQNIQSAEQTVSAGIADADARYRGVVDSAAVQRELDRRQIRETMANMGLSRSGLNATQQTAVQLSAGNKQAAAAVQRQAAVDSLKQSLAEYKMASEDARRQGKMELDESAQKEIAAFDASVDKGVSEAESTEYKAQEEAKAKKYEADVKAEAEALKLISKNQENAVKQNRSLLDKLYDNGELSVDDYTVAWENGWSVGYLNQLKKIAEDLTHSKTSPGPMPDGTAGYSSGATVPKDDAITIIFANLPLPSKGEQDVHSAARNYLFEIAGVTQDDVVAFLKKYGNTTTE